MKRNRKSKNVSTNDEIRLDSFIKIIGILLLILVIFTLITMFITREKTESPEETSIQYTKIVAGSILNRPEEDYYVLVESEDDENLSSYESIIDTYNNKDNHLRVYFVDLSDGFNSNFVSEKSNLNVETISEMKFSETTLLHISNGKIASYRTGNDIETYLKKISA